jgi:hypothetical protein
MDVVDFGVLELLPLRELRQWIEGFGRELEALLLL